MSSLIAPGPAPCCGAVRHVLALNNAAHMPRAVIERRRSAVRALLRILKADLAIDTLFYDPCLRGPTGVHTQHMPTGMPQTDIIMSGDISTADEEAVRLAITREAQLPPSEPEFSSTADSHAASVCGHQIARPPNPPDRARKRTRAVGTIGDEQQESTCRACTVAAVGSTHSEHTAKAAQQAMHWPADQSSAASCWIDLPDAGGGHALVVLRRPGKTPFSVRDRETLGMAHEALLWLVRETAEDRLHAVAARSPVHLPASMTTGGVPNSHRDHSTQRSPGHRGHSSSPSASSSASAKPVVRVTDFAQSNTPSRSSLRNTTQRHTNGRAKATHRPGEERSTTFMQAGPVVGRGPASHHDEHSFGAAHTSSSRPGRNNSAAGLYHPLATNLTRQQRAVLPLLLEGQPEADIAKTMHRSVHTIHDHAKAIYAKLGVSTRAQLVARFMMTGQDRG